jgi:hypothetical protein
MHSLVPRTALPGQSRSNHDELARSLGYFSLALGVAELLAPRALCNAIGLKGLEGVVRAYGAREIATGVAILTSHDPAPWIWARVAGDMADIATVATGVQQHNPKRENATLALAALTAVTLVDVACASRLSSEKGGRKTAIADYGDRSGFPQGLGGAKGAARDFQVPDDMRVPDLLRADTFERRQRQTGKSS